MPPQMRVLIVDDDDDHRMVMEELLVAHHIVRGATVAFSQRAVASFEPTLILVECYVPSLRLVDAALLDRLRMGNAKIVIVSIMHRPDRRRVAHDGYLAKPVVLPALLAEIARHAS